MTNKRKRLGHKLVGGKWIPFYPGDLIVVGSTHNEVTGEVKIYSFVAGVES